MSLTECHACHGPVFMDDGKTRTSSCLTCDATITYPGEFESRIPAPWLLIEMRAWNTDGIHPTNHLHSATFTLCPSCQEDKTITPLLKLLGQPRSNIKAEIT